MFAVVFSFISKHRFSNAILGLIQPLQMTEKLVGKIYPEWTNPFPIGQEVCQTDQTDTDYRSEVLSTNYKQTHEIDQQTYVLNVPKSSYNRF
jgi:hypothetical protein